MNNTNDEELGSDKQIRNKRNDSFGEEKAEKDVEMSTI